MDYSDRYIRPNATWVNSFMRVVLSGGGYRPDGEFEFSTRRDIDTFLQCEFENRNEMVQFFKLVAERIAEKIVVQCLIKTMFLR